MSLGNQLKTVVLLGALTGIFLLVGAMVGGSSGITIAVIFSLLMNFGAYWFSDRVVLAMYRAKEVSASESPRLHKAVREAAHLAGIPMPKVYLVDSATPNAFATGRNPKHAAVAATTGILSLLDDHELKGVMAHEISHIKNRDILVATIAATIAGVISYIAFMARWAALFGGFGRDDERGGGLLELLVLAIITPLAATIIQLAISRSREFLADQSAAKMLHSGEGLASALKKIEKGVLRNPFVRENKAGASLFIINPFTAKGLMSLFSTHPPVRERIRRLRSMDL